VITGFRIAYGGAQSVYGVTPDLTVLGKVMGGGFPCAAFGGRRDLMDHLAPVGPVYQAGTLSGNPVAVAAGIAALDLARTTDPYPKLEATADTLTEGLRERFAANDLPVTINRAGSMFSVFFTDGPVANFEDAKAADHDRYARLFHHFLERGVALPPSGYELWTLGTAHGDAEVARILDAAAIFAAYRPSRLCGRLGEQRLFVLVIQIGHECDRDRDVRSTGGRPVRVIVGDTEQFPLTHEVPSSNVGTPGVSASTVRHAYRPFGSSSATGPSARRGRLLGRCPPRNRPTRWRGSRPPSAHGWVPMRTRGSKGFPISSRR